jgi:hypothetical protein
VKVVATAMLCGGLVLGCEAAAPGSPCDPLDPVLAASAFVLVTDPSPGARVSSPLEVRGCSRTFESNVVWELRARDGAVLASGHATGGGVDGAGPFAFAVEFATPEAQLGHLTVYEVDASDGEGSPPGRTVIPLVLRPGPGAP